VEVNPSVSVEITPDNLKPPESDPDVGRGVEARRGALAGGHGWRGGSAVSPKKIKSSGLRRL
jgi:hypothetical protein